MTSAVDNYFVHIDLDAFFASVEQRDNPSLKGKPVIIGGLPGDRRAVVSTASYEARKYGVHSAMPVFKAYSLCPNGIYMRGNYAHYAEVSRQIMQIFSMYSPNVIQMSIDEAFIDLRGTEKLMGAAAKTAERIKEHVKKETGLTVSCGISSSMYIAKIASGFKKPDGLTFIPDGKEEDFMLSLPLEKLWGAGTKTLERLKSSGLNTTKEIHAKSLTLLSTIFGNNMGSFLYNAVRGNKDMVFGEEAKSHSISAERTFEFDLMDRYAIDTALMELSFHVLWRMHYENARSRTVCLKIRYDDFKTVSIQETFDIPINNADDLFEKCRRLYSKKAEPNRGIRLLGVGVSNVESRENLVQGQMFNEQNEKKSKLEKVLFDMENKNPALKVRKARLLEKK